VAHSRSFLMVVGALGVVFGDIGPSPLYTLNSVVLNVPIFGGTDLGAVNRSEVVVAIYCLIFYTGLDSSCQVHDMGHEGEWLRSY